MRRWSLAVVVSVAVGTYNNMGDVYKEQREYEKALFHNQIALDIKIKSPFGAHANGCRGRKG